MRKQIRNITIPLFLFSLLSFKDTNIEFERVRRSYHPSESVDSYIPGMKKINLIDYKGRAEECFTIASIYHEMYKSKKLEYYKLRAIGLYRESDSLFQSLGDSVGHKLSNEMIESLEFERDSR